MTSPAIQGTALHPAWPLPLFLLRTAWADQPYDALTEYVGGLAQAHLLEVVGDRVAMLDGVSPAAGPAGVLPGLVAALRRAAGSGTGSAEAGGPFPAPEVLSLLTAAPGDSASLPPVPAVRADVAAAGCGVLVRDAVVGQAVCLTVRVVDGEVARWRARGVADCPVAPQPDGPAAALADLGRAVVEAAELIERSPSGGGTTGVVDVHGHVTRLPAGLTPRVLELVDRVDRVEAIVALALALPGVGADPAGREPVLRRLVSALDAARRAAVAAAGAEALRAR